MNKPNVRGFVKNVGAALSKRSPEILTGVGIAGLVTTTILAVKATPKALELIEEEKDRQNYELAKEARDNGYSNCCQIDKLKLIEVIKIAWKPYIPAAVTGVASVACLIGASSVNLKRNAALATAYKLSETALTEYKDAVIETIGEKKEKEVREKVVEEKLKKNPINNNEVIVTDRGTTLCYDCVFGRYFKSDMDTIRRAITEINRSIVTDMYASLNDFYDEIGLEHVEIGDDLGWNIDDGQIDVEFSSHLASDNTPCLAVGYTVAPKYNFSSFV